MKLMTPSEKTNNLGTFLCTCGHTRMEHYFGIPEPPSLRAITKRHDDLYRRYRVSRKPWKGTADAFGSGWEAGFIRGLEYAMGWGR